MVTEESEQTFVVEVFMQQALSGSETDQWYSAMEKEIKSILKNETWTLVDPRNHDFIGSQIVLRNYFDQVCQIIYG